MSRQGAPAGHAHHFLTRLDRVSPEHVETSLMLYRDEALLRFVLARARLPEGADRIAIALDDAVRGPFLIVTRDARFVTCLGVDMRPSTRPVISRAQLDGSLTRAREIRSRQEALLDLGAGGAEVYGRLILGGDRFSREQLVAATASVTPVRAEVLCLAARTDLALRSIRQRIVPVLRRTRAVRPPGDRILRLYWKLAFAVGHLTVLSSVDGPGLVDLVPAVSSDAGPVLSLLAVEQGIVAVAVRGLWAAGKVGRELLPAYKRALSESPHALQIVDAALGLTLLGLRHGRLRAEVQKALGAAPAAEGRTEDTRDLAAELCRACRAVLDDPRAALARHRAFGAEWLSRRTAALPEGSPYRFPRPEDVPEELALTAGAAVPYDFIGDTRWLLHMVALLPWLSRARAEDLYFPAALVRAIRGPWQVADTLAVLGGYCARPPALPAAGPRRGRPCPCGSERKFKRCCGEERTRELPRAA